MTSYQPHKITRNQVVVGLVISTMLAACAAPAVKTNNEPAPIPATTMAQTKANAVVDAAKVGQEEIRFTDLASCKVETERLNAEYTILKEAFDAGKLTGEAPIKPTIQPDECEEFLAAAEQKYAAEAPTYADQNTCEANGEKCERVEPSRSNNYVQPIYRPIFYGGYSYNPWATPIYIGGRRDYGHHTTVIYRDSGSSNYGGYNSSGSRTTTTTKPTTKNSTTKSTTTKSTTSPKTTTTQTPTKPASKSGTNAITGRGSSGFGSSYKYTGKGGK